MTKNQLHQPIDGALGCTVHASGWSEELDQSPEVQLFGEKLGIDFRHWEQGEVLAASSSSPEEMGAVLKGKFQLECEDEVYELHAGQGILISPGSARRWTALSPGLLYRVIGPDKQEGSFQAITL